MNGNIDDNTQIKSAPNSPQLQSQGGIPMIEIDSVPRRYPKLQNIDDKIDKNIINTYLPDDLKLLLFEKLRCRLQPITKEPVIMAQFMLNFDSIQVITALNDNEFMNQLIGRINPELTKYNQMEKEDKEIISLWNGYLDKYGYNSEKYKMDERTITN